jgi:hypothetical protein
MLVRDDYSPSMEFRNRLSHCPVKMDLSLPLHWRLTTDTDN